MLQHPEALAIDVGSNLGQFTLFAAKFNHSVVAVEPFWDNIVRIHKAAKIEGLDKRITLITNALSDKRHEIKALTAVSDNVGGQSLYGKRNKTFTKAEMSTNKVSAAGTTHFKQVHI